MKKYKSTFALILFVLLLAVVISCEDDDERKFEIKKGESPTVANSVARTSNTSFDGTEGGAIDLATAKRWAANYRNKFSDTDEIKAHYFGTDIIQTILNETGCVGIRIYYALDDSGVKKLILVGVGADGENILSASGGRTADHEGTAADYSLPCPDYCPNNGL